MITVRDKAISDLLGEGKSAAEVIDVGAYRRWWTRADVRRVIADRAAMKLADNLVRDGSRKCVTCGQEMV